MTVYLYGLLRAPVPTAPLRCTGVAEAPVEWLEEGGVGCVVTHLPEDNFTPGRGDLLAHSDVLQEAVQTSDVLPMRFGTVFSSRDELVDGFLRPNEAGLEEMLRRLEGSVEIQVKGDYDPDAIAADILARDRTVQKLQARSRTRGDVDSRIELGRRFATVLEQTRYADGRRVVDALGPLANEVSVGSPLGEYGVVNTSFLVTRSATANFDAGFQQLQASLAPRVELRLLGPLPPYSFVDAASLAVG